MVQQEGTREIRVDQRHTGTLVLAGLLALVASFVATVLLLVLIWQLSNWSGWLLCLLVPGIAVVLLIGSWVLQGAERMLVRMWPSRRRLALDGSALAQKRRRRVEKRVNWQEPFETVRWRTRARDSTREAAARDGTLCLACQLVQRRHRICVYTHCSLLEWRRVPGWKEFPLLGAPLLAQRRILSPGRDFLSFARRSAAPTHRGPSSLPELDPDKAWPAERFRRDHGWELAFDDFCAIMAIVKAATGAKEPNA